MDGGNQSIYILSDKIAERILLAAMKAELDQSTLQKLPPPELGYSGKVQWGVDKDTVTLFARKAIGKDAAGKEVSGYVFEAKHSGTAPAAGVPTIERLLASAVKDAKQLGQEAAFIRFADND
ncbi:hypothetical protein BST96_09050 [Oceanicoccus sagamiensis]|uniref:Uncharacterized protein n=2 Tax=Oceanicoccus sagamiensis TaxID=716816 RepID=A0A1X9NJV1_9GAMM|nr:hypothetical protein BST96_09050 [Oceanicoccus sagamiensis]